MPAPGQQKRPSSSPEQYLITCHATGAHKLPQMPYSPDLLPTNSHFFKCLDNLLQGELVHNQQEAENAFQELIKSRSRGIYATGINKLISHW